MRLHRRLAFITAAMLIVACTGDGGDTGVADASRHETAHDLELVPVPSLPAEVSESDDQPKSDADSKPVVLTSGPSSNVAVIGEFGHLGSLTDASVDDVWLKWRARATNDGTTAVMTLNDEVAPTIDETFVSWVSLPDAAETGRLVLDGVTAGLDAVSRSGDLVALTNFAEPEKPGEIAGAKATTTIRIADRDGIRYESVLDGNFVVEAFGRRLDANGLSEQLFLLEHIPADAPTFYRVRVLSPATGEVSLPLNIRDKTQQVDERMSGLTRSQVIADEQGLLFTLYRGTIDGTPDGEPYAFIHTLDLADGVWCLLIDPELELDTLAGALAVGGDRLYVSSANGKIGSIEIPSISDINRSPEMDWVTQVGNAQSTPPVLLADDEGVWIGLDDGTAVLRRFDDDGYAQQQKVIEGRDPTALAFDQDGEVIAAGDGWSTLGDVAFPDWFGSPAVLLAH